MIILSSLKGLELEAIRHQNHFSPRIFNGYILYYLGSDIKMSTVPSLAPTSAHIPVPDEEVPSVLPSSLPSLVPSDLYV